MRHDHPRLRASSRAGAGLLLGLVMLAGALPQAALAEPAARATAASVEPGAESTQAFAIVGLPQGVVAARIELLATWRDGEGAAELHEGQQLASAEAAVADGAADAEFVFVAPADADAEYAIRATPVHAAPGHFSFGLRSPARTLAGWTSHGFRHDFAEQDADSGSMRLALSRGKGAPAAITGARLWPVGDFMGGSAEADPIEVPLGAITLHHIPIGQAAKHRITGYGIDSAGAPRTGLLSTAWYAPQRLEAGVTAALGLSRPTLKAGTVRIVGDSFDDGAERRGYLTAEVKGFGPTGPLTQYRYQWYRNGRAIPDAVTAHHWTSAADRGAKLTVRVSATFPGAGKTVRATSKPVLVKPGVVGFAEPEQVTLVLDPGTMLVTVQHPAPVATPLGDRVTVSYQWRRNGVAVKGATRSSYRLGDADSGAWISVRVTPKRPGYASASVDVVRAFSLEAASGPQLEFTGHGAYQGQSVRVDPASYGPGVVDYVDGADAPVAPEAIAAATFQWLRNGRPIKGATAEHYTFAAADAGARISARVRVASAGLVASIETTPATPKIRLRWLDPGELHLEQAAIEGGVRFSVIRAGGTPGVRLAYQWFYDGRAVRGATKAAYTRAGDSDPGLVTVRVTLSRKGYASSTESLAVIA